MPYIPYTLCNVIALLCSQIDLQLVQRGTSQSSQHTLSQLELLDICRQVCTDSLLNNTHIDQAMLAQAQHLRLRWSTHADDTLCGSLVNDKATLHCRNQDKAGFEALCSKFLSQCRGHYVITCVIACADEVG